MNVTYNFKKWVFFGEVDNVEFDIWQAFLGACTYSKVEPLDVTVSVRIIANLDIENVWFPVKHSLQVSSLKARIEFEV